MQHTELANGRWHTLTLADQLGNIGSEYSRIVLNRRRHDQQRFEAAFNRYLELLDLTIADPRWGFPRKKELLRLREISCDEFPEDLQSYFDQFALMARHH
jgi:hypothetical protein